jgi:hypothetical protein
MYRYLQIRADAHHAGDASLVDILTVVAHASELRRTAPLEFSNGPGFPWCRLLIVRCDGQGNYASEDCATLERANLLELVCSDSDETLRRSYERLACDIGRGLGWEVTAGDEGVVLFSAGR